MKNIVLGAAFFLLTLPGVALASPQKFSSQEVCQAGEPLCLDLVVEEMQRRFDLLAQLCDHDVIFALQYLRTTETLQDLLNQIGYENPASVIREDALFADYYFDAYDNYHAGIGTAPAWQIAFDAAKNRSVTTLGNLILGVNAHIQRDLPFVLYNLYAQGTPVSYEDHTLVNLALQQVDTDAEIAKRFDPTYRLSTDEEQQQGFQLIANWRELAYRNFERLRDASDNTARAQVAAEIEGYSAFVAGLLQQTYSYPPGTDSSERDAYCQKCAENNVSVPEPDLKLPLLLLGGTWLLRNKLKPQTLLKLRKAKHS